MIFRTDGSRRRAPLPFRLVPRLANSYPPSVTLKQHIHQLVDELPNDSPLLLEVRDTLRMNHALAEAVEDVRAGRTYTAEEFTSKVQEQWPGKTSE